MLSGAAGALILPVWRKPDPTIILPAEGLVFKATNRFAPPALTPVDCFGLAPIKAEGRSILYDSALFSKTLWPGLEKYWREHYENTPDFEDLFK
jgi:hypothetical protein